MTKGTIIWDNPTIVTKEEEKGQQGMKNCVLHNKKFPILSSMIWIINVYFSG